MELPFLIQDKWLKIGFDQEAGTKQCFLLSSFLLGPKCTIIKAIISHLGWGGAQLISTEWSVWNFRIALLAGKAGDIVAIF